MDEKDCLHYGIGGLPAQVQIFNGDLITIEFTPRLDPEVRLDGFNR